MVNQLNTRRWYFQLVVLALLFMLLVFDPDMAKVYLLMIVGDFIWMFFDINKGKIEYPIEKSPQGRGTSLFIAAIGTGVFLVLGTFLVSRISVAFTGQSVFQLLAQATPALKDNKILTYVGWALIIPIVETTFFFGRVFEGLQELVAKRFKARVDRYSFNLPLIVVMVFVSALFALFHLTAKGLSSEPLLLTFIFAMVSMAIVVRTKHLREAIFLHMITNSLAVLASLGLF